jgi:hypothetical protein
MGVGFCEEHYSLTRMLGSDEGSWAYHGEDGCAFGDQGLQFKFGKELGEEAKYGKRDTVGCGVDFRNGRAFFTKNGKLLGKFISCTHMRSCCCLSRILDRNGV